MYVCIAKLGRKMATYNKSELFTRNMYMVSILFTYWYISRHLIYNTVYIECDAHVWFFFTSFCLCAAPESIHALPTGGIGNSWGRKGSVMLKNKKEL